MHDDVFMLLIKQLVSLILFVLKGDCHSTSSS